MTNDREKNHLLTNICSLSRQMFSLLKLNSRQSYTLCVGHLSQEVYFIAKENKENMMHIPHHVAEKLGLSQNYYLNIWRNGQHIYLGPVVGVFVSPRHLRQIQSKKIPESIRQHFQANSKAHCFLYYFSIGYINWEARLAKGYLYESLSNTWRNDWFPLPNVIYDRCIGLNKKELALAKQIRDHLGTFANTSFINKDFLGKWELYTNLRDCSQLQNYLPQTSKYTNNDNLFNMLHEHGFIFLKSSDGYGAREVLSIKKGKQYYWVSFKKKGLIKLKLRSKHEVKKLLRKFVKPKLYIVQLGIKALKIKNMHMDLRLLLQKDIQGLWQVTYNRARITGASNTIINSTLAKKIINYEELEAKLKSLVHIDDLPSKQTINGLSLEIADCIERKFGAYGELGLDLIIDQKGKIWFIEANSKPTKYTNSKLGDPGTLDQFLSVLEYAKYLQKVKQNGKVQIRYMAN